jgi:hypothetical protein
VANYFYNGPLPSSNVASTTASQNGGEISSSVDHVEENGAKFNPTLARQFLYFLS